jgi:hypothetical protein
MNALTAAQFDFSRSFINFWNSSLCLLRALYFHTASEIIPTMTMATPTPTGRATSHKRNKQLFFLVSI